MEVMTEQNSSEDNKDSFEIFYVYAYISITLNIVTFGVAIHNIIRYMKRIQLESNKKFFCSFYGLSILQAVLIQIHNIWKLRNMAASFSDLCLESGDRKSEYDSYSWGLIIKVGVMMTSSSIIILVCFTMNQLRVRLI